MKSWRILPLIACVLVLVSGERVALAQGDCGVGPTVAPNAQESDLDNDASFWGVFCEGSPSWEKDALLRCSLKGGTPYSNVHCYRNFPSEPDAEVFTLRLSFLFTPPSTCNNAGGPSRVQALEFKMNKWYQGDWYEFALQWNNVGPRAPQWRYWDPHRAPESRWVPIRPAITQCLKGGLWHTLTLQGRIVDGSVRYDQFIIDNKVHTLGITLDPVSTPGEPDHLAIAVQLDGNFQSAAYDVLLDKVQFLRDPLP